MTSPRTPAFGHTRRFQSAASAQDEAHVGQGWKKASFDYGLAPAEHTPMPTVLRVGPYRFHFYSREGIEPPHIHVARDDSEAKFWLTPVSLATSHGLRESELREIERLVEEHCDALIEAYTRFHGDR
jgi:hypothetical protein